MAYTIRKSDGTVLLNLVEGQIDNSVSSITFIGKNVSNFGEIQNNDYLHLLENFASNSAPANQLRGQLWYDVQNYKLKFYDGGSWQSNAVLDFQATQPVSSHPGYLWFDTTTQQLYINSGVSSINYTLIGPETIVGFGETRLVSSAILATDTNTYPVIKVTVDDEVIQIISKNQFYIDSTNSVSGFTKVFRGVTNKNYEFNDAVQASRSIFSNSAVTATNIVGGASGSIAIQAGSGSTTFIPLGGNRSVLYSDGSTATWISLDTLPSTAYANTASNLDAGSIGALPYQTSQGNTSFISLENTGYALVTGATRPVWAKWSTLAVGSASLSTTATYANQLLNDAGTKYLSAAIAATSSTIVQRDTLGNVSATIFQGTATTAYYADLAENYLADAVYEPGTVVMIGGDAEITASVAGARALGAISTRPAYLMNSSLTNGLPVALKGRIPVKIQGPVSKGDRLIAGDNGIAVVSGPSSEVFAIALGDNKRKTIKLIEAVIL